MKKLLAALLTLTLLSACGAPATESTDEGAESNPIDDAIGFYVDEKYQKAVSTSEYTDGQTQYYIAWSEEFYNAAGKLYEKLDDSDRRKLMDEVCTVEDVVASAKPVPPVDSVRTDITATDKETEPYRLWEAQAKLYREAALSMIERIGDGYSYYYAGCPDLYVWKSPRNIPEVFQKKKQSGSKP